MLRPGRNKERVQNDGWVAKNWWCRFVGILACQKTGQREQSSCWDDELMWMLFPQTRGWEEKREFQGSHRFYQLWDFLSVSCSTHLSAFLTPPAYKPSCQAVFLLYPEITVRIRLLGFRSVWLWSCLFYYLDFFVLKYWPFRKLKN